MSDVELEVQEVDWGMLRPHAKRGALYLLDRAEDLMTVAAAMRDDDVVKIRTLLAAGALQLLDEEAYDGAEAARFRFAIVQPWVVAQGPIV